MEMKSLRCHSKAWTKEPEIALLLLGLCVACGCRGDRLPTATVEGTVLYQGRPLGFGSVTFQPDTGPPARGTIGSDGTFQLSTYGNGDGAVLGRHRVRISCFASQAPDAPPPDPNVEPGAGKSLIPRQYTHYDTSNLEAEVTADNEPYLFKLNE